jgi:hypothetical protein
LVSEIVVAFISFIDLVMSTYKFLIIDESVQRNLLPQMKKDFEVRKIYRITFETTEIPGLPKINWDKFQRDHAYLYGQLHDIRRTDQIILYFFTGEPQGLMWSLTSKNQNFRLFEISSSDFLDHVKEVGKLAEIEETFSEIKRDFQNAESSLESSITDDYGGHLGVTEELSSLYEKSHDTSAIARKLETQCLNRYSQISSQPWS